MNEAEVKSRTITLGELWDIMNDYEIPYDLAAQVAMIEASKQPREAGLLERLVDKLRGCFHGCENL